MKKGRKESIKMKYQKETKLQVLVISGIVLTFVTIPELVGIGTASAQEIINAGLVANASRDKVWSIVADVNNEPNYWSSIKEIKNLRENTDNNVTERDVTLSFANAVAHQIVKVDPRNSIIIVNQTQGPITGTRTMTLSTPNNNPNVTKIEISWNMDFSGIPIFGRGFAKDNIFKVTEEALKKIASAAEKT